MTHIRDVRLFAAEVKFLVPPALADDIRSWARARLERDPHGTGPHGDEYRTTSNLVKALNRLEGVPSVCAAADRGVIRMKD